MCTPSRPVARRSRPLPVTLRMSRQHGVRHDRCHLRGCLMDGSRLRHLSGRHLPGCAVRRPGQEPNCLHREVVGTPGSGPWSVDCLRLRRLQDNPDFFLDLTLIAFVTVVSGYVFVNYLLFTALGTMAGNNSGWAPPWPGVSCSGARPSSGRLATARRWPAGNLGPRRSCCAAADSCRAAADLWRAAAGFWRAAAGFCRAAAGFWRAAAGSCRAAAGFWRAAAGSCRAAAGFGCILGPLPPRRGGATAATASSAATMTTLSLLPPSIFITCFLAVSTWTNVNVCTAHCRK